MDRQKWLAERRAAVGAGYDAEATTYDDLVTEADQSAGMLAQARARGAAFDAMAARGLPAVHGEVVEGNVAGYHYYPGRCARRDKPAAPPSRR
jgi:hypothetical protein